MAEFLVAVWIVIALVMMRVGMGPVRIAIFLLVRFRACWLAVREASLIAWRVARDRWPEYLDRARREVR